MSSWSTLPLELLTEILGLVYTQHHQSLSQCQLTCKNWSKPAQSLLYSNVKLSTPQQVSTFLKSVSLTNTSSKVKKVELDGHLIQSPAIENLFPRLFESCPSITHLEADQADMAFWTKLLREFYKGNTTHLQSLPAANFNSDDSIKIYGYIASALHATLTSVYVHDWPTHNPSFKNNEVAQKLNCFTNLESLFVHVGGIDTVLEILSVIQYCPKLRELHIKTIEERKVSYFEGDSDNDTVEDYSLTHSTTNITNLKIDSITLTSLLIRRILETFPRLGNFELNNIPEGDYSDDEDEDESQSLLYRYQAEGWKIDDELWIEFLLHIHSTTSKYHLSKLFFNNVPYTIERLTEASGIPNDFLELLYVRRKTYCDIKSYVQISSDAGDAIFNRRSCCDKRGYIQVIYGNRPSEDDTTLQHMSLLDSLGDRLKTLRLRIPASHDFKIDHIGLEAIIDGYFLGHIFKTCPQLTCLMVDRACIYHYDPNLVVNKSIEMVRFTHCNINPSVFSYISHRLPQLAHLHIAESDFIPASGHILDTPKNIDLQMPYSNLKLLVWENYSRRYQGVTALHLKINKKTKSQYYTLKKSSQKIIRSTANSFGASSRNHSSLSIDIQCTKIEHLVVCTRDFNIHINVGEMTVSKGTSYLKSI